MPCGTRYVRHRSSFPDVRLPPPLTAQDSSFHQPRAKYSLLLSHGSPSRGGSWTHFADTRRAYADLPAARKAALEELVIEHDLWHSRRLGSPDAFKAPLPHERATEAPAFHRLVQTAPDGRKTLYLAAHAKRVVGWDLDASQTLIWELIDWCTQPKVSRAWRVLSHKADHC